MTTAGITAPCEGIPAAISSRQAPIFVQITGKNERFDHLVAVDSKLHSARGSDGAGKRAATPERRTYLKIAADGSPILIQGVE